MFGQRATVMIHDLHAVHFGEARAQAAMKFVQRQLSHA
jgi:hypothetical protein